MMASALHNRSSSSPKLSPKVLCSKKLPPTVGAAATEYGLVAAVSSVPSHLQSLVFSLLVSDLEMQVRLAA